MKKLEEQSMKIEQIKLKITNMSQKKDFLKNLIKSKTSIQKSQKIRTTTNFTSRDEISTISINTSRLNVSFVDEFSHGFNTIWNKLVTKFNSRQNKINNVLDSFSSLDQTKI